MANNHAPFRCSCLNANNQVTHNDLVIGNGGNINAASVLCQQRCCGERNAARYIVAVDGPIAYGGCIQPGPGGQ